MWAELLLLSIISIVHSLPASLHQFRLKEAKIFKSIEDKIPFYNFFLQGFREMQENKQQIIGSSTACLMMLSHSGEQIN